uniref:Protein prune homolog n=1 Tax=Cacopsylla melanoneura TaxID=428564 RepID=A0A8D8YAS3_9HEMI
MLSSFHQYLYESKCSSASPLSCDKIHIVLGNESCDLDSAVCALLYAFYLTTIGEQKVVPVLNIPAKHLPIKTEVVSFLQDNGVALDSLVFRDSLPLEELCQSSKLKATLVDHHVLANKDTFLRHCVVEIIDHRPISPSEKWSDLERGTTMDIVGSCVTHVAKKMLASHPDLISKNRDIANLIYGTILLDTACLSPQANRATPADHDVIQQLKTFHPDLQSESSVFESLLKAKSDISHLTPSQLLVKDLKITKHGIPIVGLPILVQDFVTNNPDLESTLNTFLVEHKASTLVLMGQTIRPGNIARDLPSPRKEVGTKFRVSQIRLDLRVQCLFQ